MKSLYVVLLSILSLVCGQVRADSFPAPSATPRFVNDFAAIIDDVVEVALEDSLRLFEKQTSTEVCIVTLDDLQGYEIADYAQQLGQKWGVGKASKKNGVLMLVKPKTRSSKGEAYIVTGYGLEGALPDLKCSQIVNNVMIPEFKENNYSGGIAKGAEVIMKVTRGEYAAELDEEISDAEFWVDLAIFFGMIILGMYFSYRERKKKLTSDRGFLWFLLTNMLTQSSSRSDWGAFSSGKGSFGGGGFGGFGGGSFGGGGGGGSW